LSVLDLGGKMLGGLTKFWKKYHSESKNALYDAVRYGTEQHVRQLISNLDFDPNAPNRNSRTPLEISLLRKNYNITALLLDLKADPNVFLKGKSGSIKEKAIQPYLSITFLPNIHHYTPEDINELKQRNNSVIRLLTVYGATEEKVEFPDAEFKQVFLEAREYRRRITDLEQKLENLLKESKEADESQLKTGRTLCLELATTWNELYLKEKANTSTFDNTAFKNHYTRKVQHYMDLLNTSALKKMAKPEKKTDSSSPREEEQPLLDSNAASSGSDFSPTSSSSTKLKMT
jgi:hypothetical protein